MVVIGEKAVIKKKKEDQSKAKDERKKHRETKLEETLKAKSKVKTSSNQGAAHLATTVSRVHRCRSPQRSGKDPPSSAERQSDSSLEGACW